MKQIILDEGSRINKGSKKCIKVYDEWADKELTEGLLIPPVALCNQSLIDEFLASEQEGRGILGATRVPDVLTER